MSTAMDAVAAPVSRATKPRDLAVRGEDRLSGQAFVRAGEVIDIGGTGIGVQNSFVAAARDG
jgi:hypothetical protein